MCTEHTVHVYTLVRAGADVTSLDFLGNSPLSLALAHDNIHMASILAAAGAPCHVSPSQRWVVTWFKYIIIP